MGILRRRAAAIAVGVTLAGAAGATTTEPTTRPDRYSAGGTTAAAAATKRTRSETAAAAGVGGAESPSWTDRNSAWGLRGSSADGELGRGRRDDEELADKLIAELDGGSAPRGDLASKLIDEGAGAGAGARGDAEFAATLAEALGSPGREGELAEKLLAGLGEGGERQQRLAAELLAGLGATRKQGVSAAVGRRAEYEPAVQTDGRAAPEPGLGGKSAGGSAEEKDEEGKLSAAIAEALDHIRRHEAEGGEGWGVLEHILTTLMNVEDGDEVDELPPRGLVREPAWHSGGGVGTGDVAVLGREDEHQERSGLPPPARAAAPSRDSSQSTGAQLGGNDAPPLDTGDAGLATATGGFVDGLPAAAAAQRGGHEDAAATAVTAAAGAEGPVVESVRSQLAGAFRGTFERFLGPFRGGAADGAAFLAGHGRDHGDRRGHGLAFGEAERAWQSARQRRLQTSSAEEEGEEAGTTYSDGEDGTTFSDEQVDVGSAGNKQIEIVTMNGPTATDWNGAYYTLEVGTTIPGQTQPTGKIIARGTISEGEQPSQSTVNLERGCYVIYTTAGTRPYDVLWELQSEGELYNNVEGGGQDFHTFGTLGALCGMSECYRQCFEDNATVDDDEACPNFGDLLAPPTEPAGFNCTCAADEELDLRLECLERGCDSRSQCYLLDDSEITTAPVLTITSYVQTVTNTIDVIGMEKAVAEWLDLDPAYVDLVRVNGLDTSASSLTSRRRLGSDSPGEGVGFFGRPDGEREREWEWGGMDEEREDWQRQARDRGLQTAIFKRLEFRIIGTNANDFPFVDTLAGGVPALQAVLRAQDEASGVQEVTPYTAEYTGPEDTRVARDLIPAEAIAGSGGGTGVDEETGEVVVQATDAPSEFGDFTTEIQFLIGAGLVVVVSFFLSIVACIVCRMKRRDRREFIRKNASEDGRRKPVAYVDPWGSVARTFQKDSKTPAGNGSISGSSSRVGGHGGGSAHGGRGGSRTANSSASA